MILHRKLEPRAKIYQDKLAHELGISRTPLINALKKLEQEKLIKAIPRRGFYVQGFSLKEMIHIFELREVLEGLAARRACLHISGSQVKRLKHFFKGVKISNDPKDLRKYAEEDRKFHHFLMEMGGSDFLSSILGTYNILTFSYQGGFQAGLVRPPRETIREHLAIIEAVTQKDPDKAEELARLHLKISAERLKRDMEEEKRKSKNHH